MGREEGVVVVCRCNDVTLSDIENAIREGIEDFELLRKYLRIGFGPCQGRSCLMIAARILARKTGKSVESILKDYVVRPPIIPIPAKLFLEGAEK